VDNTIPQVHQVRIVEALSQDLLIDKIAELIDDLVKRNFLGQIVLDNGIEETTIFWFEPSSYVCNLIYLSGISLIAGNDLLYLLVLIL
jgi:hypothetical protein